MIDPKRMEELKELLADSPYVPSRWLGRGAAADVFVVQHKHLGKKFALKLIHPHLAHASGYVERLQREARALGRMDTTHIVRVVDLAFAANGAPFLVLELMKGQSLAQELLKRVSLPLEESLRWTRQLLTGLQVAHDLSVVHRDVSPGNLFLREVPGYERTLKILDFGLAGVLPDTAHPSIRGSEGTITSTGMLVGSPGYASPEALRGKKVSPRADIYGAGVVLFEMLTGLSPFDLEEIGVPAPSAHMEDCPPALDAIVLKATSVSPEGRYPSAKHFLDALAGL